MLVSEEIRHPGTRYYSFQNTFGFLEETRGVSRSATLRKSNVKTLVILELRWECRLPSHSNFNCIIKSMKSQRWFNRIRILTNLRIASAVTLMSAAAAVAFVAVNSPGPLFSGKLDNKSEGKLEARSMRSKAFGQHLKTFSRPPEEKVAERNRLEGVGQEVMTTRP